MWSLGKVSNLIQIPRHLQHVQMKSIGKVVATGMRTKYLQIVERERERSEIVRNTKKHTHNTVVDGT